MSLPARLPNTDEEIKSLVGFLPGSSTANGALHDIGKVAASLRILGENDGPITRDIDAVFGSEEESGQYVFDAASRKWRCTVCGCISEGELPPDQ